jgi:hypothetical protein
LNYLNLLSIFSAYLNNLMKHRQKFVLIISFFIFCFFSNSTYSQRDTLRIFYKGMQTEIVDSNYNKISEWAKKLNGKRFNVEINAYYDVSDFKKAMAERAENVQTVVIRKSRDFTTVKFAGAIKGKKSQRSILDIIYWPEGFIEVPKVAAKENKNTEAVQPNAEAKQTKNKKPETEKASTDPKEIQEPKKEKTKPADDERYTYIVDSAYVNGALEVTKRKVKKSQMTSSSDDADKKDQNSSSENSPKEKPAKQEKYVYITDSVYVNGVLEVTKRKVKRQLTGK